MIVISHEYKNGESKMVDAHEIQCVQAPDSGWRFLARSGATGFSLEINYASQAEAQAARIAVESAIEKGLTFVRI